MSEGYMWINAPQLAPPAPVQSRSLTTGASGTQQQQSQATSSSRGASSGTQSRTGPVSGLQNCKQLPRNSTAQANAAQACPKGAGQGALAGSKGGSVKK
ncbi:hypothetical protein P389DRAFT_16204 [Cystobasidium minutum MCA 4210]|uniref:uncharacterized protein n=1 Tax=Cystobasidium minutum MCA 4210 TaxID=1397322 RepID=UPI0034CF8A83|eukprot:jgi/Rhomi1/16204/CE16203_108